MLFRSIMTSEMQDMVREGTVVIASQSLYDEMDIYEWDSRSGEVANAPDINGAHDDHIMAAMVATQGMKREGPRTRAGRRV